MGYAVRLSKGRICDVILYSMQSGSGISPSYTLVVDLMVRQSALNFDYKFELDCTSCLWNNYHSIQASIGYR